MAIKRKRQEQAATEELEIDLSLPEPLSKKAARRAKKTEKARPHPNDSATEPRDNDADASPTAPAANADDNDEKKPRRSKWGIWIGNLPWMATKLELRAFLRDNAGIDDRSITRVHMPAPTAAAAVAAAATATTKSSSTTTTTTTAAAAAAAAAAAKPAAKNKGFAYVDFDSEAGLRAALALSERPLGGRRVLIKNALSFEGRPAVEEGGGTAVKPSPDKPPSKRIFVGNLGFDVTKEELEKHFGQCGEVVEVFVATFEDSGKCKGFAWVTFSDVESATSAVRGWINLEEDIDGASIKDEDGPEGGKMKKRRSQKPRKKMVNKINGRLLRCEFAEDPSVRYRKRFGGKKSSDSRTDDATTVKDSAEADAGPSSMQKSTAHERRRAKRKMEHHANE